MASTLDVGEHRNNDDQNIGASKQQIKPRSISPINRSDLAIRSPRFGPVTPLTYISRDAQRHLANLNAGPLAL